MKKFTPLLVWACFMVGGLSAQVSEKTIGLRLGYDAQEIAFQQPIGNADRLELSLGVNTFAHNQAGKLCRGVGLNCVYQWVNDLTFVTKGLKWYLGLGAAVLDHGSLTVGMYGAGVLGQIGVEYSFHSPWQVSVDYRPGFYWLPGAGNIYRLSWNVPCLAVRYRL